MLDQSVANPEYGDELANFALARERVARKEMKGKWERVE